MAAPKVVPPNGTLATWRLYWRMTRPGFLSITAVGCALGLASAAACGCGFDWVRASITVLLALLAHAGANVLNDYCDELNGADAANTGALFPFTGGSRFIQNGHVSARDTHRWAFTLLGISALGGMWLALQSGGGLLLVGLLGMALAWAYSAPPFKLMSRGLGELTVALAWWLVVIGADYSQRGHFFIIPAYVGVSFALLIANILLINGLPDAPSDASVGKRTLATRMTPKGLASVYLLIVLFAHAWVIVGVWLLIPPTSALWALITLPTGLLASWQLYQHAQTPAVSLRPAIVLTIVTANLHGVALAVAMLLPHL